MLKSYMANDFYDFNKIYRNMFLDYILFKFNKNNLSLLTDITYVA